MKKGERRFVSRVCEWMGEGSRMFEIQPPWIFRVEPDTHSDKAPYLLLHENAHHTRTHTYFMRSKAKRNEIDVRVSVFS